MNQLLSTCGDYFAVALKDRVYCVCIASESMSELLQLSKKSDKDQEQESAESSKRKSEEHNQQKLEELKDILAVAVTTTNGSVWCAVSRREKTLAIYKLNENNSEPAIQPYLVYNTPKRVGSLCFSSLERKAGELSSGTTQHPVPVLIAGDLAGDAFAYSLTEKRRRLLLGHTASMLTGVAVVRNHILTADRDEKIRISSFPDSFVIEGFLLGHTAYVTSMDAVSKDGGNTGSLVATCGGDKTLRLWNLDEMKQAAEVDTNTNEVGSEEQIPTEVAINEDGSRIAVIFDRSKRLDIYEVRNEDETKTRLSLVQSIEASSQPLAIAFSNKDTLFTLLQEPDFLVAYTTAAQTDSSAVAIQRVEAIEKLNQEATKNKIIMPETILEKDTWGNIKLKKLNETRGPAAPDAPWNRVERIEIAKQRNKRHKKRKLEKRS